MITLRQAQKMSPKKVMEYLTKHPYSSYYRYKPAYLLESLGKAEANQHLLWLILINDKVKSDLQEVAEQYSNEKSSNLKSSEKQFGSNPSSVVRNQAPLIPRVGLSYGSLPEELPPNLKEETLPSVAKQLPWESQSEFLVSSDEQNRDVIVEEGDLLSSEVRRRHII